MSAKTADIVGILAGLTAGIASTLVADYFGWRPRLVGLGAMAMVLGMLAVGAGTAKLLRRRRRPD